MPSVIIRLGRSAAAHNRCGKCARSRGVVGQVGCYLHHVSSTASVPSYTPRRRSAARRRSMMTKILYTNLGVKAVASADDSV